MLNKFLTILLFSVMANLIPAFSCKGFVIKLVDSKGWFNESETTPVIVFLGKGEEGKE